MGFNWEKANKQESIKKGKFVSPSDRWRPVKRRKGKTKNCGKCGSAFHTKKKFIKLCKLCYALSNKKSLTKKQMDKDLQTYGWQKCPSCGGGRHPSFKTCKQCRNNSSKGVVSMQ